MASAPRVLTLPGWQGSGALHWQTRWEVLHGFERVEQDDWQTPKRGDWMARLEEVLMAHDRPAFLVAHSLGCHLVAAWAAHSRHCSRVLGAFLVAPPDCEREDFPPVLSSWRKPVLARLPFVSQVVFSRDDPYCSAARAMAMAAAWGARLHDMGSAGHVNAESGLGDWPDGLAVMRRALGMPAG